MTVFNPPGVPPSPATFQPHASRVINYYDRKAECFGSTGGRIVRAVCGVKSCGRRLVGSAREKICAERGAVRPRIRQIRSGRLLVFLYIATEVIGRGDTGFEGAVALRYSGPRGRAHACVPGRGIGLSLIRPAASIGPCAPNVVVFAPRSLSQDCCSPS